MTSPSSLVLTHAKTPGGDDAEPPGAVAQQLRPEAGRVALHRDHTRVDVHDADHFLRVAQHHREEQRALAVDEYAAIGLGDHRPPIRSRIDDRISDRISA